MNPQSTNGFYGVIPGGFERRTIKDSNTTARGSQVLTFASGDGVSSAIVIPGGVPSRWYELGTVEVVEDFGLKQINPPPGTDANSYLCQINAKIDNSGSVADYFPGGAANASQYTWYGASIAVGQPSKAAGETV